MNPVSSNYYDFFGLEHKLDLDLADLEKRFYSLSRQYHPDRYTLKSREEQQYALDATAILNDAYRTLRDPVARVEYLLAIEGARVEGKNKQQAPPELLEEVFELNESLDELRETKASGGDIATLKRRLQAAEKNFQGKLGEVDGELQVVAKDWDKAIDANADDAAKKGVMARLNELLNRRSYIRNLVVNVQKELL